MKASLLLPHGKFYGNLLWRKAELPDKEALLAQSLELARSLNYWVSRFPEGDGVTFKDEAGGRSGEQILSDLQTVFAWLKISLATQGDSNAELAALESEAEIPAVLPCTVIVPISKVHLESSFDLGPFRFVCAREVDPEPHERLGDWGGSYLEFRLDLPYSNLLRLNRLRHDNDVVILQCLAMAEHAMDLIRFGFSSFMRPQYTPNPAGQLENGMYAVEIIPIERTHLKPVNLAGISRPMSASNNWLGPEIHDQSFRARVYLEEILRGRSDELALAVKGTLRFIRQAFYSLGAESQFLTLLFALDGVVHPKKDWTGIKHHAYVAALTSHGDIDKFKTDLVRYEELYSKVRNVIVHQGKDFYELSHDAGACCEDLFEYLKQVVILISDCGFVSAQQLREQGVLWLKTPEFANCIGTEVNRLSAQAGKLLKEPKW